jgi:predicted secreted acid phosphatase
MELVKVENGIGLLDIETSREIANFESQMKKLKEAEDSLKKSILDEMEKKGNLKLDTDEIIINYVAPTDREVFDSKKFRADMPDVYDEYVKMSPVKASVRVKVK